jgi:ubiquinone/menaquinone biosynthesis C-methylase UbiE
VTKQVDLYNTAYGSYETEVYRQIRIETYGEDLGQTSWVTNEESNHIPQILGLSRNAFILEVGSGSGRYALQLAQKYGCRVIGVDVNEEGIHTANRLAEAAGMSETCRFEQCDASKQLPYADGSFEAVVSNDVLCHIRGRRRLLSELFRVMRPLGKLAFSDALIIGGLVSHEEIATRSSIGYYSFSPPGMNEQLIEQAGFRLLTASDTTANASSIAKRWHDARARRQDALTKIEGRANFEGLQRFLFCVHALTSERRLLRFLYAAQKPYSGSKG